MRMMVITIKIVMIITIIMYFKSSDYYPQIKRIPQTYNGTTSG